MLPDNLRSLADIELDPSLGNRIQNLASLLAYVLRIVNPSLKSTDGSPLKVGERVKANESLFSNPRDIFFALGVRNYYAHPEDARRDYSEDEKIRANGHLVRAVQEICNHPGMPKLLLKDLRGEPRSSVVGTPAQAPSILQVQPGPVKAAVAASATSNPRPSGAKTVNGVSIPSRRHSSARAPRPDFLTHIGSRLSTAAAYAVVAAVVLFGGYSLIGWIGSVIPSSSSGAATSSGSAAYVSTTNLNLRKGPGTHFLSLGSLPKGTRVALLGEARLDGDTRWVRVRVGDRDGWLSEKYLSATEGRSVSTVASETGPPAQPESSRPDSRADVTDERIAQPSESQPADQSDSRMRAEKQRIAAEERDRQEALTRKEAEQRARQAEDRQRQEAAAAEAEERRRVEHDCGAAG